MSKIIHLALKMNKQVQDNIESYKVDEATRNKIRHWISIHSKAVGELETFLDSHEISSLPTFSNHQCPYCGTTFKGTFEVCSSCSRSVSWVHSRKLQHAGYQNKQGHTYSETLSGPCRTNEVEIMNQYLTLRANIAELEREFVVLKETSTAPVISDDKKGKAAAEASTAPVISDIKISAVKSIKSSQHSLLSRMLSSIWVYRVFTSHGKPKKKRTRRQGPLSCPHCGYSNGVNVVWNEQIVNCPRCHSKYKAPSAFTLEEEVNIFAVASLVSLVIGMALFFGFIWFISSLGR